MTNFYQICEAKQKLSKLEHPVRCHVFYSMPIDEVKASEKWIYMDSHRCSCILPAMGSCSCCPGTHHMWSSHTALTGWCENT